MDERRRTGQRCFKSTIIALLLSLTGRAGAAVTGSTNPAEQRLRVIIETDAGGDPDDEQSLVRFLVYANEWDIEGIIANRAQARPGENLNSERTGLGIVQRLVRAYGQCYPNLLRHDPRYPKPEDLLARTVAGYNTNDDGVRLITAAVDSPDPRPIWYSDWGTDQGGATNNLRRALDRVLRERGKDAYARFKQKFRLSSSENFAEHTTKLEPPFPLWVDTFHPERDRKRWYHRFSTLTARAGGFDLERDVRIGHGPLGALYPTNTTHWQKEGDTMTFLYLIPTGMNDPEHPTWGSWAGRYGLCEKYPGEAYYWANQSDAWNGSTNRDNTVARWAEDLQNDFRARMEWCVKSFAEANHPPVVRVLGDSHRTVRAGETITIDASESEDLDGQSLRFEWFTYPEAGTCYSIASPEGKGTQGCVVQLKRDHSPIVELTAPQVSVPVDIHLILRVRDSGAPPLARYARIILAVAPP